jgi:hypothetical protein
MRLRLPFKKAEVELERGMPLSDLVRRLVAVYSHHPQDINNGNCDYFAEDLLFAAQQLGNIGRFFVTPDDENLPGHCWAFVSGKHFDAEAPEGVADWRELPIFKRSM